MNDNKYKSIFLILSITGLVFLSTGGIQAQVKSEFLVGTWAMDYNGSKAKMSNSKKAHFDSLKSATKQRMLNFYSDRKFTFNADGSYQLIMSDGIKRIGTYTLSSNELTLIDTNNQQKAQYSVKVLNKNNLMMSMIGPGSNSAMIKDLHFKSVNEKK